MNLVTTSDVTRKKWPPEKTSGLECRKCGCRDMPVDHTTRASGRIIRYRHCRYCGQRATTSERILD